jgi:hypothetical protein
MEKLLNWRKFYITFVTLALMLFATKAAMHFLKRTSFKLLSGSEVQLFNDVFQNVEIWLGSLNLHCHDLKSLTLQRLHFIK